MTLPGTSQNTSTNTVMCFLSQQRALICLLPDLTGALSGHIYLKSGLTLVLALDIDVVSTLYGTELSHRFINLSGCLPVTRAPRAYHHFVNGIRSWLPVALDSTCLFVSVTLCGCAPPAAAAEVEYR